MPTRLFVAATRGDPVNYAFCKEALNLLFDVHSTYSSGRLAHARGVIRCDDTTMVYVRVLSPHLCLVLLLPDTPDGTLAIYDCNFVLLKEATEALLKTT